MYGAIYGIRNLFMYHFSMSSSMFSKKRMAKPRSTNSPAVLAVGSFPSVTGGLPSSYDVRVGVF